MDAISRVASDALRVLIVDDHSLLNETVSSALEAGFGFAVDSVTSVSDAHDRIRTSGNYDVILLDYDLPGSRGLSDLRNLIDLQCGSVALFSGVATWLVVERAIDLGAKGFIPKTAPLKSMGHAIRLMAEGSTYIPVDFMRAEAERSKRMTLKPRERLVMSLLCEGLQNKEIAHELGLSDTIVKMDVKAICKKLAVTNRTQAVIEARRQNLV